MTKVLSLFDGISCGMLAFQRAGINVTQYHACEIDPQAIAVSVHNHPSIIQRGCVKSFTPTQHYDYIIGGSPCQGFSFAGKELAFDDPRSILFFEYVRILESCRKINPNIKFLLENVVMQPRHQQVISTYLNTTPTRINSATLSAQKRIRDYWTNWNVTSPHDKKITLRDIIIDQEYPYGGQIVSRRLKDGKRADDDKTIPLLPCIEVAQDNTKSRCMTTVMKDCIFTSYESGRHLDAYGINRENWRYPLMIELERLQTLPDHYTSCPGIPESKRSKVLGEAWTVDVIAHILKCSIEYCANCNTQIPGKSESFGWCCSSNCARDYYD